MCIAYYSVNDDRHLFPKACILKVYKDGRLVQTFTFPVRNPNFRNKAVNEACKAGELMVKEIIDAEMLE